MWSPGLPGTWAERRAVSSETSKAGGSPPQHLLDKKPSSSTWAGIERPISHYTWPRQSSDAEWGSQKPVNNRTCSAAWLWCHRGLLFSSLFPEWQTRRPLALWIHWIPDFWAECRSRAWRLRTAQDFRLSTPFSKCNSEYQKDAPKVFVNCLFNKLLELCQNHAK